MSKQQCEGCNKETDSKLKCPKCVQLDLPSAFFCSQECFKSYWGNHVSKHKSALSGALSPSKIRVVYGLESLLTFKPDDPKTWATDFHLQRFLSYSFTGPLRPWPQTIMQEVPDSIPKPDYAKHPGGRSISEERMKGSMIVKYEGDAIEKIRKSCRLGRQALDLAHSMAKPGVTPNEIDIALHDWIVSQGAYPSPLNYYGFPKSICTSVNEVVCHGIPDLRPLQDGDIINVDVTVYYDGMHGDLNETFLIGDVDKDCKRLVKAAYDSLSAAIAICKPGEMYRKIGTVVSDTVEPQGFSVVRTYCGHGIGKLFHTSPNVPHQRNNKAKGIMEVGHVFTIEPMINAGKFPDEIWPDQWTSVTKDGSRSAQFEHQILITQTGKRVPQEKVDRTVNVH